MKVFVDHYIVLGLPTGKEGMMLVKGAIIKAYKSKALQVHPDKRPKSQAEEASKQFRKLKDSYDVLLDANKRRVFHAILLSREEEERLRKRKREEEEERLRKRKREEEEEERLRKRKREEERLRKKAKADFQESERKRQREKPKEVDIFEEVMKKTQFFNGVEDIPQAWKAFLEKEKEGFFTERCR